MQSLASSNAGNASSNPAQRGVSRTGGITEVVIPQDATSVAESKYFNFTN